MAPPLATLRARRDVNAAVAYPQTAVVLDALGCPVRLLRSTASYLRRVERVPYPPNGSDDADASGRRSASAT